MEKQQNIANCDSMATTVTVKEYSAVEYQDPPPAYRNAGAKMSPMVQTAKIVAVAAVAIAGMLSFALVFSAWLSSSNNACQYSSPSIETVIAPQAQALRSLLMMGASDLDSSESKVAENTKKDSSEEEEDRGGVEDAITMIKLPVELNLQEHMLEKNQRSHMHCVIEKKKAEEIVDEQSKPLPSLLGINMTTDPRYLHFTGEKVAISCHSGNDEQRGPPLPVPLVHGMMPMQHHGGPPQLPFHPFHHHQQQQQVQQQHQAMPFSAGSGNIPIHIIGPIPLTGNQDQIPLSAFQPPHHQQMHPNLIPIIIQQGQASEEGPIFLPPPLPEQHSNEIRERALHHPVPIMPRQNTEHVIRPRSTDAVDKKRVKRCACDCACKNHHDH